MNTDRKTYFSFDDACNLEHTGDDMYAAYSNGADPKESKKKKITTALGVVAFATVFAPPVNIPSPVSESNHIACVAGIIEQAENETSPKSLCETLGLYMHNPMWLPTHKHFAGSSDFDDEIDYRPLPIREYEVSALLGSIEQGLPPVFAGWEDELEDVVYHV